MSPLVLYQNKILLKDNKLASDLSCCCQECPTNTAKLYGFTWPGDVASNTCPPPKGFRFASSTMLATRICNNSRNRYQFSPAIGVVVTHVFNAPIKANCGAGIQTVNTFTFGTGGAFNGGAMEGFFVRCYDSFGALINLDNTKPPLTSDTCTVAGRAYGVSTNITFPILDGWSDNQSSADPANKQAGGSNSNVASPRFFTLPAGTKSLDIIVTENSNRLDIFHNSCQTNTGTPFVGSSSWQLWVQVVGPAGNGAMIKQCP